MGIGFVCTITGVILAGNGWTYAYLVPIFAPNAGHKSNGRIAAEKQTQYQPLTAANQPLIYLPKKYG